MGDYVGVMVGHKVKQTLKWFKRVCKTYLLCCGTCSRKNKKPEYDDKVIPVCEDDGDRVVVPVCVDGRDKAVTACVDNVDKAVTETGHKKKARWGKDKRESRKTAPAADDY